MTEASSRSVDAEVVAALAGWLPRNAGGLTPTVLAVVEPAVRSAVAAAAPRTLYEGRWLMRNGFALTAWVYAELGTVDVRDVFHPDIVETFVISINRGQSDRWKYDTRRALTKIGRAVDPGLWTRAPTRLHRSAPARPYSSAVEESFRLAAVVQCRPGRADEAAVVALSLGAGLNGPEIAAATPSDVVDLGNGRVAVQVNGKNARLVPIRAAYTELLLRAVDLAEPQERFVRAVHANSVTNAAKRVGVHGDGHLRLRRARATWLTAHLMAPTPLAALRVIAGPLSANTLDFLLASVESLTADAAALDGLQA